VVPFGRAGFLPSNAARSPEGLRHGNFETRTKT
jgi:hypothetical protein